MRVSGNSSGGVATISGLSPATMYTVVVAAENSAGTGDYSDPVDTLTSGTHMYLVLAVVYSWYDGQYSVGIYVHVYMMSTCS